MCVCVCVCVCVFACVCVCVSINEDMCLMDMSYEYMNRTSDFQLLWYAFTDRPTEKFHAVFVSFFVNDTEGTGLDKKVTKCNKGRNDDSNDAILRVANNLKNKKNNKETIKIKNHFENSFLFALVNIFQINNIHLNDDFFIFISNILQWPL